MKNFTGKTTGIGKETGSENAGLFSGIFNK
jgi:hypothetical protein